MRLFCDCKTDEEKSNFFLSGRAVESGVIAPALVNDVAMAYHRCAEFKKEVDALRAKIEQQKPVGIVHRYGRALNGSAWLGVAWNPEADELPTGTAIYALPGAQPAPSVPTEAVDGAPRPGEGRRPDPRRDRAPGPRSSNTGG